MKLTAVFPRSRTAVAAAILGATLVLLIDCGVSAFFTGDNGCASGELAASTLNDLDGVQDVQQVPFEESGVVFTINDQVIDPLSDIVLEAEGDYNFAIVGDGLSDGGSSFVGALLRVQQRDELDASTDLFTFVPLRGGVEQLAPDAEVAEACEDEPGGGVAGITQMETETAKTSLTGRFVSTSADQRVFVDVTVVLTNTTDGILTYAYEQYIIVMTPAPGDDETPVPAPSLRTLQPTRTLTPTVTVAPTFEEVCNICGNDELRITMPDAVVVIAGNAAPCKLVAQFAADRLIPPGAACDDTIAAVVQSCGCEAVPNGGGGGEGEGGTMEPTVAPATSLNTLRPTVTLTPTVTVSPTYEELCNVCGSADLSITLPDAVVVIGGTTATCAIVAKFGADRLIPPGAACDDTIAAVVDSCGCKPVADTGGGSTETPEPETPGSSTENPGTVVPTPVPEVPEPTSHEPVDDEDKTKVPRGKNGTKGKDTIEDEESDKDEERGKGKNKGGKEGKDDKGGEKESNDNDKDKNTEKKGKGMSMGMSKGKKGMAKGQKGR